MPPLEITDDHRERIEALREELADRHAGPYATVGTEEVLAYLLDLADAVDDEDRSADADHLAGRGGGSNATGDGDADRSPFDREAAREALEERNRRHGDPEDADRSDLYSIAAAFDVSGRSDMTKDELVEAIIDAAAELSADPFARVDVEIPDAADGSAADSASSAAVDSADDESANADNDAAAAGDTAADDDAAADNEANDDGGAGQLNAMMSLLDTHDDKWREGDGDARYEVELPDGSVETARTKDDVRALLFRNY